MTTFPQFVACKFRTADTRSYTYIWNGPEEIVEGDQVKVADNRSDGWKRVFVVSVTDQAPPFECKPILGKLDDDETSSVGPETTLDSLDSANFEAAGGN